MDFEQRMVLNKLLVGMCHAIIDSTLSMEIKRDALCVVDYFLFNPFNNHEPDFFTLENYRHKPLHGHAADKEWVPMLSHLLNTSFTYLKLEVERLEMLTDLPIDDGNKVTAAQLRDGFVSGLAKLSTCEPVDYNKLRQAIINEMLGVGNATEQQETPEPPH